jgi:hypothetical protein
VKDLMSGQADKFQFREDKGVFPGRQV